MKEGILRVPVIFPSTLVGPHPVSETENKKVRMAENFQFQRLKIEKSGWLKIYVNPGHNFHFPVYLTTKVPVPVFINGVDLSQSFVERI